MNKAELIISSPELDDFVALLEEYVGLFPYEDMYFYESWSKLLIRMNGFKKRFQNWEQLKTQMQQVMQSVVVNFEETTTTGEES